MNPHIPLCFYGIISSLLIIPILFFWAGDSPLFTASKSHDSNETVVQILMQAGAKMITSEIDVADWVN